MADDFDEKCIREITNRVMEADIDPKGMSAADLLDDDQGALLYLQIEMAISQVVETMRLAK